MKNMILKVIFPALGILLWLAICYPVCNKPEGFNYFMFWVIAGLPFGAHWMFLKLAPKGYGLSGTIGAFALKVIVGGLIGGACLLVRILRIPIDLAKEIRR